jgi:branched-chain amino acid transport system substrate-binding protein
MGGTGRGFLICAVLGLTAAACSEPAPDAGGTTTTADVESTAAPTSTTAAPSESTEAADTSVTQPADDGSVVSAHAGEAWFLGEVPGSATPADPAQTPLVIGMINQEDSPVGSFPEVRAAAEAAAAWINAELGGVGGRPIELRPCVTAFSVEQSQACAQQHVQDGAVAVLGGVDITSNGSIPLLETNGIPYVGGIPVSTAEMTSANVFAFSGGTPGALVAFVAHAVQERGAQEIVIAYGEFESFTLAARDIAAPVAESLGANVDLVPFPIAGADLLPVLTRAQEFQPDALIVGAADSSCVPVMTLANELGIDAQIYLVGACAAEEIIAQVPDDIQAGVLFNSEGPPDQDDPQGQLYLDVVDRYATEPAGGAGTVGFRAMMNLWSVLQGLTDAGADPEAITSADVTAAMRAAVDAPSFWGHPFTCDGQQIPGLPAICAPQQTLFGLPNDTGDATSAVDEWIDVAALTSEALG